MQAIWLISHTYVFNIKETDREREGSCSSKSDADPLPLNAALSLELASRFGVS